MGVEDIGGSERIHLRIRQPQPGARFLPLVIVSSLFFVGAVAAIGLASSDSQTTRADALQLSGSGILFIALAAVFGWKAIVDKTGFEEIEIVQHKLTRRRGILGRTLRTVSVPLEDIREITFAPSKGIDPRSAMGPYPIVRGASVRIVTQRHSLMIGRNLSQPSEGLQWLASRIVAGLEAARTSKIPT